MFTNTGSYWGKKRGNIGDRRKGAGKKGMYTETYTQAAGTTRTLDLSGVLINNVDGICNGTITNHSLDDLTIALNCRLDETVPYPDIKIKSTDEPFDLGMLNGMARKIVVKNESVNPINYTVVGV